MLIGQTWYVHDQFFLLHPNSWWFFHQGLFSLATVVLFLFLLVLEAQLWSVIKKAAIPSQSVVVFFVARLYVCILYIYNYIYIIIYIIISMYAINLYACNSMYISTEYHSNYTCLITWSSQHLCRGDWDPEVKSLNGGETTLNVEAPREWRCRRESTNFWVSP